MNKKNWKRAMACVLCAAMISPSATVLAVSEISSLEAVTEETFSVSFEEDYPEIGKALHVKVTGLAEGEDCSFSWSVDGKTVSQGESYTPTYDNLEKFISVTVQTSNGKTEEHSVYFSKLPVIYIDTNDVPIVDKENYVQGQMTIQGNKKFHASNILYDGAMEMRGRGNSSWEAPKKPYRIKLDSKADLLGMGKSKHWTLLANYYDPSLSRNKLSYDFSGELGLTYMSSENVILILNDEYQGVYQLCEHIRVDENRIDITDWESIAEDTAETIAEANPDLDGGDLEDYLLEDMAWITGKKFTFEGKTYDLADYGIELPEIDGGYLMELDKNLDEVSSFYSKYNQPLMFKSPEYVKTNPHMMQYIKGHVDAFEDAIRTKDGYTTYQGEAVHYTELYDMDALAAYFLVTELFFNIDGMKKSTYLYKDNGEPVKMGPIWDMDWSAGGPYDQGTEERWQVLFYDDEMVSDQWYRSIIGDPYFAYRVKKLYDEYRDSIGEFTATGGRIDQNVEYLQEAGKKNDAKWTSQVRDFLPDTENLKNWMNKRISWMDRQMESVDSLLASWGDFQANQENGEILRIEKITSGEDVLNIRAQTSSKEAVGFYINGLKYGEEKAESGNAQLSLPLTDLKEIDGQELFVVVRVTNQGVVCTDYQVAAVELPEETVTPEPTETEAPTPTETETPKPTETEIPTPTEAPVEKESVTVVFTDIYKDWYTDYVQYVYDNGLMSGIKGTTLFEPNTNITKAQVAQVLYNMEGQPSIVALAAFRELKDLYINEWYASAVAWAYSTGVVTGDTNAKKFFPNADVTREQLALMMYRYAQYKGHDTTETSNLSGLKNAENTANWALDGVKWAVGTGLISGIEKDGGKDLAPQGNASRAQMAAILKRFCENMK